MPRAIGLDIWYEALGSEIGIFLETDNPTKAMAELYRFRKEAQDPQLESISILYSPNNFPGLLALVKTRKDSL